MKRFIIMMVIMFSMTVAHASFDEVLRADVSGLSETQKAELAVQIAKMKEKAQAAPVPKVSAAEVKEYSALVTAIGTGVKDTAVELGVAANDFVKTPVGMLTAALIAWNYVGETILGVAVGGMWFAFMLPGWVYFYRRLVIIESITHYTKGSREDGKRKVVAYADKFSTKIGDGLHFMLWFSLVIICATGFIVIF